MFNNLILYDNDIDFDYLYSLADKYCVNEKILEQIKEKKKCMNIIKNQMLKNI